jgi:hypothetical protein
VPACLARSRRRLRRRLLRRRPSRKRPTGFTRFSFSVSGATGRLPSPRPHRRRPRHCRNRDTSAPTCWPPQSRDLPTSAPVHPRPSAALRPRAGAAGRSCDRHAYKFPPRNSTPPAPPAYYRIARSCEVPTSHFPYFSAGNFPTDTTLNLGELTCLELPTPRRTTPPASPWS